MKKLTKFLFFLLLLNQYSDSIWAQFTFFTPKENFAIEVSLPNTELKRLPIYRNSISSLIVVGDHIIGGTSANEGLTPFIFVASLKHRQIVDISNINEIIPGQQSIQTGFCRGINNVLFAGTLANKKIDGSKGDGHLLQVDIDQDGKINIKDMGIPLPGEGILSLTLDAGKRTLYGVSYPSGLFFKYVIDTKDIKTYKNIAVTDQQIDTLKEYDLVPLNYLCKNLIQSDGLIFGSMPINSIFYFDPKNDSFHIMKDIPDVWGRRTLGQVESWAKSINGKIYGGNAGDGQLFEIDPVTKYLKNLGKPIGMNRLRGLCFGSDGKLYGIAGGQPGYSHLFSYNDQEGFTDLGNPEFTMVAPGIQQGILWRGFQLGTITSDEDGKYIVMGEDESLSQLLIFAIEEKYEQRIGK
jgi:hypothetical protein